MKIRILQVFFGEDGLPYKDQARTVHYPITGNGFQNANNTTQIRFYFSQLSGENTTWVAVSKLPNGKIGSKVLETFIDDELNEPYALLELDSYYTQYKGDVFISLQGYQGGVQVTYDEETEIYEISGTPTIASTGSIKFTNNYAPSFVGSGQEQNITIQQLLGYLSSKADIGNTIYIVADIEDEDLSGYEDGQTIYDLFSDLYYEVNSQVQEGYEPANGNGLLGNKGALVRFFDLTDSITLQEIYNILGYMRYGVLNVDGLDYLVIMDNNNSIKAYDLFNKQLFDYEAVPEDTFYDVIDTIPTKFVEHKNEGNKVYGTNASAQDTTIPYSSLVVNNGIVQRESTGQIRVPTTPTQSYHATSKSYVDSNYGKKVQLTIDNDTFVLTVKLLNNFDTIISQASVDLPLESIVVSAQYYDTYTYQGVTYTKVLVIVLATTSEPIIVPIGDLVSGLVSETTFNIAVAQLQTNINKCVQQTNTQSVVYGTNGVGNQTTIDYGIGVLPNGLVRRDALGQINVSATPSSNGNATSKQYVDTFGRTLEFSIDNSTYVMTFKLKDNNGNVISTQTIDLPLETMVVDGSYDDTTESLILELKNGQTITIPISDLISGLVTETSLATTLANYYTKAQIDQMVAGFVFADVDDFLSNSSTNPVENRVITNALDTKANTQDLLDGSLVPNKALAAQQIENVSEESGVVQETPFISQGTSTNNNTEETPTAPVAKQLEKQGNSVVVNQQFPLSNNSTTSKNGLTLTYSNGIITISGTFNKTVDDCNLYIGGALTGGAIQGHKYLLLGATTHFGLSIYGALVGGFTGGSKGKIITANSSGNATFYISAASEDSVTGHLVNGTTYNESFRPISVDLTQWFGSNDAIPQDLLDHPEHWSWYDNTNNAYNTGSLDNSTGRYLVCTGRNQWNEETELGSINQSDGSDLVDNTRIRTKYIEVNPNVQYYIRCSTNQIYVYAYDKNKNYIGRYESSGWTTIVGASSAGNITITMPSNAKYIRFYFAQAYGTTYKNDTSVQLWYTTGDGYDQYYPYIAPKVYDTGNEVLRSAGSVKDKKLSSGLIDRPVGSYTFTGNETWAFAGAFAYTTFNSTTIPNTWVNEGKVICSNGVVLTLSSGRQLRVMFADNPQITSSTNMNSVFSSGTKMQFELATPTTEQGTPFPENIEVDDYGTMYWLDTNNELVSIPQGCKLFYPADYVLLMDDLNIYVNGDVTKLALKTDLASDKQELSTVDSQLKEALGGTLRQLLATSKTIDFNNTAWVDLGTLTYTKTASGLFSSSLSGLIKAPTSSAIITNSISTLYKAITSSAITGPQGSTPSPDLVFAVSPDGSLFFNNLSYTDTTTFKNAMKGVLLAYEKAS